MTTIESTTEGFESETCTKNGCSKVVGCSKVIADANNDGKLDREELNNYEFKFWFETGPVGKEAAGFFGQAFEAN